VESGRPVDVEDALETTDAFWAARRRESSRVSLLTCIVVNYHVCNGRCA
jgi:hypothetical protein